MPQELRQQSLQLVEKCMQLLQGLQNSWPGAGRGRAIVEHLLEVSIAHETSVQNPVATPGFDDLGLGWGQLPGSDLFGYETVGAEFFDVWRQATDIET